MAVACEPLSARSIVLIVSALASGPAASLNIVRASIWSERSATRFAHSMRFINESGVSQASAVSGHPSGDGAANVLPP